MAKKTVFIALKGSPAIGFLQRTLCKGKLRPGSVHLASKEELESWRQDVEQLAIEYEPEPNK